MNSTGFYQTVFSSRKRRFYGLFSCSAMMLCASFFMTGSAEASNCKSITLREGYLSDFSEITEELDRSVLYGSLDKHSDKADLIIKTLERDCSHKDSEACIRLGDIHYFGELANFLIKEDLCDHPFDEVDRRLRKRSAFYYGQACDLKIPAGCGSTRLAMEPFVFDAKEAEKVAKVYEKGCNLGDKLSCSRLAMIYYTGYGVVRDRQLAYDYLKKSEDSDFSDVYDLKGLFHYNGEFLARDPKLAFENYRKGCDSGSGFSCGQLGALYYTDNSAGKNMEAAMAAFEKGCSLGDGNSCFYAGSSYLNRKNSDIDYNRAYQFFDDGCDLGEASSCFYLGYMNEYGLGVKNDYRQALIYVRRGCSYRDEPACRKLGLPPSYLLFTLKNNLNRAVLGPEEDMVIDENMEPSVTRMLAQLTHQCSQKNADACSFLGEFYIETRDASGRLQVLKATDYMKKGCDLQYADACYNLGMLYYESFIASHRKEELFYANTYFRDAANYFPSMRNSSMYNRTSVILDYFDSSPKVRTKKQ